MAVIRLDVEYLDVGAVTGLNVEVFASSVPNDVDHDGTGSGSPAVRH